MRDSYVGDQCSWTIVDAIGGHMTHYLPSASHWLKLTYRSLSKFLTRITINSKVLLVCSYSYIILRV